jgi:hypothetical protein
MANIESAPSIVTLRSQKLLRKVLQDSALGKSFPSNIGFRHKVVILVPLYSQQLLRKVLQESAL